MTLTDFIGTLAAVLTTASFLPQAWHTFKTKDVSGISLGMYSVFTAGVAGWLVYGLLLQAWPIVIANLVTLTHPTKRVNGTVLVPADIAGSTVEWGTCSGTAFGTASGTGTTTGLATTFTTPNLAPGTWCHRAKTRLVSGVESLWSNVVVKTILESPPQPPVIVTVSTYAYEFRPRAFGGFKLVRVADVKQGVPCSEIPGLTGSGFGIAEGKVAICGEG